MTLRSAAGAEASRPFGRSSGAHQRAFRVSIGFSRIVPPPAYAAAPSSPA
ncbi:hypothetical protein [Nonomuraea sp. B5E05]